MHIKDYYAILEIETSATLPEIKKAYRRLALQFHPDKKQEDPYAAARFTEIKEAYEILTSPAKKEYYLQQRWYDQSTGKRKKQDIITLVTVLKQTLELEKYVSALDVFRMDKEGLQQYILGLLSDNNIEQLKRFNEPETKREIIHAMLRSMHPLPILFTKDIVGQLFKLSDRDTLAIGQIERFVQQAEKKSRREKYSLIIIIAATAILCLLIWLAGL